MEKSSLGHEGRGEFVDTRLVGTLGSHTIALHVGMWNMLVWPEDFSIPICRHRYN